MNRHETRCFALALPLALVLLTLLLTSARACAAADGAGGAPGDTAVRLPVDAYAPSPLAMHTPDPRDHGRSAAGEAAWSVGPHGTKESQSRFEDYTETGKFIGLVTGVTVMVIHTRGQDGIPDFLEPIALLYGGALGAYAGWIVGGAIAMATGG